MADLTSQLDPELQVLDPMVAAPAPARSVPMLAPTSAPQGTIVNTSQLDPELQALDPMGASGLNPSPIAMLQGNVNNEGFEEAYTNLARKFKLGSAAISQSTAGWKLASDPNMTFADAQKEVETDDIVRPAKQGEFF